MEYEVEIPDSFLIYRGFVYDSKTPVSIVRRQLDNSLDLRDDIYEWMKINGFGYRLVYDSNEYRKILERPHQGNRFTHGDKSKTKYSLSFNSPGVALTFKLRWL